MMPGGRNICCVKDNNVLPNERSNVIATWCIGGTFLRSTYERKAGDMTVKITQVEITKVIHHDNKK